MNAQQTTNIVDIRYAQNGKSTQTNSLGMREMQAKAYEARNKRFLLIKAPPASGKSRAMMFIALDKLQNQGIKKVVIAVPEKNDGDRLLKLANRFFNIDKLSINLIDTINPFQRAYEVMSKSVDAPTLKVIQDTIAEQKLDMTIDHAVALMPAIKEYVNMHDGKIPQLNDPLFDNVADNKGLFDIPTDATQECHDKWFCGDGTVRW